MTAHLKYLWYVLRHKWYVFVAGRVLGVPLWQLLIHDMSKFSRAEWGAYVRWFKGGDKSAAAKAAFGEAWAHHWQNNPHHWQYWCGGDGSMLTPMPERYAREMVADWYGAAMAQGKEDCWAWYRKNRSRYLIVDATHARIEQYLLALQDAGLIKSEWAGPDPEPPGFTRTP